MLDEVQLYFGKSGDGVSFHKDEILRISGLVL